MLPLALRYVWGDRSLVAAIELRWIHGKRHRRAALRHTDRERGKIGKTGRCARLVFAGHLVVDVGRERHCAADHREVLLTRRDDVIARCRRIELRVGEVDNDLAPGDAATTGLLLRYLAAARTPSTAPLKSPGASGVSTSASTAMWISVALMPTSVAFGFSLLDCAPDGASVTAEKAMTIAAIVAAFARPRTIPPVALSIDRDTSTSHPHGSSAKPTARQHGVGDHDGDGCGVGPHHRRQGPRSWWRSARRGAPTDADDDRARGSTDAHARGRRLVNCPAPVVVGNSTRASRRRSILLATIARGGCSRERPLADPKGTGVPSACQLSERSG